MHTALYGSDRDADDLGNFPVIQTFHVSKDDGGLVLLAQAVQCCDDLAVAFGLGRPLGGVGTIGCAQARGLRGKLECSVRLIERAKASPAGPSAMRTSQIQGDPKQPSIKLRFRAESSQPF